MNYNIPMPSLGADMEQGKIMEWKIKLGDNILKNQVIASVETTKSVIDIESFRPGKVIDILAKIGDVISVGKPIVQLYIEGDNDFDQVEPIRLKITPAAKKMAEDNGLDLYTIKGSGISGEIVIKDIVDGLTNKLEKGFEGINLRMAISNLMSRSKKEIPHYYLKERMHLDNLIKWLDEKNTQLDPTKRILLPTLLMKAVITSLLKFPDLNGFYKDQKFIASQTINLGIVFSVKNKGVLVPAVLDAEKLNLFDFNTSLLDLADRTKNQKLTNRELSEGTFTITNLGDLGSDEVYGIIFPPQVAILGIGHVRREPIIDSQDQLRAGFVVDITLSADHRITDGIYGAQFLNDISKKLNNPITFIE